VFLADGASPPCSSLASEGGEGKGKVARGVEREDDVVTVCGGRDRSG
jgi:hypothetical protein